MSQSDQVEEPRERWVGLWVGALAGAVGMVVSPFLPWFVEPVARGISDPVGLVGLAMGIAATAALLLSRRGNAAALGLTGLALAGFAAWTLGLHWGSVGFAVSALALAACASALPGDLQSPERGAALRAALDRRLNPGDDDSKLVDTIIIGLIALNVLLVIVETEPDTASWKIGFEMAEAISTLIFSLEYLLRLWLVAPRAEESPTRSRLRFASSPMALVDFVAIVPFFLVFIEHLDLRIARAIRLMRLLRILKMGRYAHAVRTLVDVVSRKKEELAISTFVSVMALILTSSGIYFVEHSAQPEAFRSIPEAMWWSVVTLTSVGYGDVSPITPLGKVFGAVVCMLGVLLVSLPAGILASGFMEVMREQRQRLHGVSFHYCPHCGESLLPEDD